MNNNNDINIQNNTLYQDNDNYHNKDFFWYYSNILDILIKDKTKNTKETIKVNQAIQSQNTLEELNKLNKLQNDTASTVDIITTIQNKIRNTLENDLEKYTQETKDKLIITIKKHQDKLAKKYNKNQENLIIKDQTEFIKYNNKNINKNNKNKQSITSSKEALQVVHNWLTNISQILKKTETPRWLQSSTAMFLQLPEYNTIPGDIDISVNKKYFFNTIPDLLENKNIKNLTIKTALFNQDTGKQTILVSKEELNKLNKQIKQIKNETWYDDNDKYKEKEETNKKINNLIETQRPELFNYFKSWNIKLDFNINDPITNIAINTELFPEEAWSGMLQPKDKINENSSIDSYVLWKFDVIEIEEWVEIPTMSKEQLASFYCINLIHEFGSDTISNMNKKLKFSQRIESIMNYLKKVWINRSNIVDKIDEIVKKYEISAKKNNIEIKGYLAEAIDMRKGKKNKHFKERQEHRETIRTLIKDKYKTIWDQETISKIKNFTMTYCLSKTKTLKTIKYLQKKVNESNNITEKINTELENDELVNNIEKLERSLWDVNNWWKKNYQKLLSIITLTLINENIDTLSGVDELNNIKHLIEKLKTQDFNKTKYKTKEQEIPPILWEIIADISIIEWNNNSSVKSMLSNSIEKMNNQMYSAKS